MDTNALIDIIVPVYNVEPYIRKCLDSLLNQSYENYIISLVDDGSTDNSGKICDEYAAFCPQKIRVYHKLNGGLSDARNYGVNHSNSEFVLFVDSDDYIHNTFLSILVHGLICDDIDIVITPLCKEYIRNEKSIMKYPKISLKEGALNSLEALQYLCYEKEFGSFACGKLIRRNIVLNNMYPKGKYYEDSYITFKQIFSARSVYFIPSCGYFYLQRQGSIQRSKFQRKHLDLLYASVEMVNFFYSNKLPNKIVESGIYKLYRSAYITLYHARSDSDFKNIYTEIRRCVNKYKNIVSKMDSISLKEKCLFKIMVDHPMLCTLLLKIR